MFLHLSMVVDPLENAVHLIRSHSHTGCPADPERDRQIPLRAMQFAARTLAVLIAAGEVAFQQGTAQRLCQRRKGLHQPQPALLQYKG